jgi:hypothetical protein
VNKLSLASDIEFFTDVAAYADGSWFPTIPQSVIGKAVSSKHARQFLSRWLIRSQSLEIPSTLQLGEEERWLLTGRESVVAMAEALGRRMISSAVRAVVLRRDVEKLRDAFGDEGYAALLDLDSLTERRVSGAWIERAQSGEDVRSSLLAIGHALLAEQLKADDRQLKARLRLMFARVWPAHAADDLPSVREAVRNWLTEQQFVPAKEQQAGEPARIAAAA